MKAIRQDAKAEQAKSRYVARKRRGVKVDVGAAQALVGQRAEIYFEEEGRWQLATINSFRSAWKDNGTRLEVLHELIFFDVTRESSWEDLTVRRYALLKTDLGVVEAQRIAAEAKRAKEEAARQELRKKQEEAAAELEEQQRLRREAEKQKLRDQYDRDVKEAIQKGEADATELLGSEDVQALLIMKVSCKCGS